MPLNAQTLIQGLLEASKGGKVTEIYNALQDWRPSIDTKKLNSMTDAQLVSLWNSGTGASKGSSLSSKQRKKLISDIGDRLVGTQKLISRELQGFNSKDSATSSKAKTELDKNIKTLFTFADSLNSSGLFTKPLEEQLKPLLGSNFDAVAFANNELASAKQPSGQVPQAAAIPTAAQRAQEQEAAAYAAAGKNPDGTPIQGAVSPGTAAPPTTGRVLSDTEKQQLDAAYARIQSGKPGEKDQANIDYAQKSGLWSPSTNAPTATPPTGTVPPTQPQGGTTVPGSGNTTVSPGTSPTGSTVGFDINSVQWKPNITDAQKQEFVTLFSKAPAAPGSEADKTNRANWAYATNGAPYPTAGAGGVIGAPPPSDMIANLKALGLSDETIAGMSPEQQGLFAAIGATMQKQIDNGNPLPQTFTTDDLHRFAEQAVNDPTIDAFYKDQLRLGVADLNAKMGFLTGDTQAQFDEFNRAFPQQDIAASKAAAAAGQAYSGFRNQAKERLKADQQSILQSTTRQAQQNLRNLGTTFETTYGSKNLPQQGLSMQGGLGQIRYNALGNVPGQLEQQKQVDIANKNQSLIEDAKLIRGF